MMVALIVLPVILTAAVTIAAMLYVASPLVRESELPRASSADGLARRLELVEERDRALAALKELEFDHRTGKVSDRDYREQVGPLRRRAAETLRALEPAAKPDRPAGSRRATPSRAKVRS
jgi:hypothetical protein